MPSGKNSPGPTSLPGGMSTSLGIQPLPPGSPSYHRPYVSPAGMRVSYEDDWIKQHHLDCDGISLPFYQMLHKKFVGRDAYEEPACIPETVVFEHNFPQAWFSYEEENKELIKRPGKMLDAATMYEYFSAPCPGAGDVVAQFFHVSIPLETAWKSIVTPTEVENHYYTGQYITYVEFFTPATLSTFLFGQHRKPNGVLQRFVVPKGQGMSRKNMQIEVLWTPAITTARMRVNRYSLDNRAVPLANRLATYDGAPHLSDEVTVADETKNAITCICQQIVEHFHRTEKKWLSRMLVYFKTDDKNVLWLLWCGGLRIENNALNPSFLRVPLMPHMRKEIISSEEASTTVDRLEKRRQQQKRLLALDYEFFHVTKDIQFAQNINGTHRRQAKELRLRGLQNIKFEEGSIDPRKNVNHPLHEAFVRVCSEEDDIYAPYSVGYVSSSKPSSKKVGRRSKTPHSSDYTDGTWLSDMQEEEDGEEGGKEGGLPGSGGTMIGRKGKGGGKLPLVFQEGEITPEMVQNELIALAMDVWYAMYSSTLSQYPTVMPTSTMELASPIAVGGVLTRQELAKLTDILGIHSIKEDQMVGGSRSSGGRKNRKNGPNGDPRRMSLGVSRFSPMIPDEEEAPASVPHRTSIYHPAIVPTSPSAETPKDGHREGEKRSASADGIVGSSLASHNLDIYKADLGVLSNARRLDRPSAHVEKELVAFFKEIFQHRGEEITKACFKRFPSFFELF